MTDDSDAAADATAEPGRRATVIGPDGRQVEVAIPEPEEGERSVAELVEEPAKVMRIGQMVRQLLDEVRSAPLDDASRARLREIHQRSITELEDGLAPELVEELERLSLPFESDAPSDAELRIAQAQLVGWLEGLFHGIQATVYAQQVAAQSQLQNMRRALPGGPGNPGQSGAAGEQQRGQGGGMYL